MNYSEIRGDQIVFDNATINNKSPTIANLLPSTFTENHIKQKLATYIQNPASWLWKGSSVLPHAVMHALNSLAFKQEYNQLAISLAHWKEITVNKLTQHVGNLSVDRIGRMILSQNDCT